MPSLGIRIRLARIRNGHTQRETAEALGVSPRTVKRWESGTVPEDHQLARVAEYLGETTDAIAAEVGRG